MCRVNVHHHYYIYIKKNTLFDNSDFTKVPFYIYLYNIVKNQNSCHFIEFFLSFFLYKRSEIQWPWKRGTGRRE